MAEVFNLDKFRKKKKVRDEEQEDNIKDDQNAEGKAYLTECMILSGFLYRKYPQDFGMGIIEKILEITKNFNLHTFQKRKEIVRAYNAEELVKWLSEHEESDWVRNPTFYRAIAEEIKFRFDYSASRLRK